jgi:hypothetical protein
MKKNCLFIRFILAAGCLMASLQQGFCVVGYINEYVTNGYYFITDPLISLDPANSVRSILTNTTPALPDRTAVYQWDVTNQVFSPPSIYTASNNSWSINYKFPPGKGFVLQISGTMRTAVTFVGTVPSGFHSNFIAGTNKFSLVGYVEPIAGALGASLGFPRISDANVLVFNSTNQTYLDPFTYYTGYGWYDPDNLVDANGPVISVGQSFFVQNPGPDTNWNSSFALHVITSPPVSSLYSPAAAAPDVTGLTTDGTNVTLAVSNPSGGAYDVQFSTDRVSWKTIASAQSGSSWTGPVSGEPQGYYQVVRH